MKKLVARLLCAATLALCATAALPGLAYADGTKVAFARGDIFTTMQNDVEYDIGGGSAKYVSSNNTLYLDGITLTGGATDLENNRYAMIITGDITIYVTGLNTITQTNALPTDNGEYGLYIQGSAVIAGNGSTKDSLVVSASDENNPSSDIPSVGIAAVDLSAYACTVSASSGLASKESIGIGVRGNIEASYSKLIGIGGGVTSKSKYTTNAKSVGILAEGSLTSYSSTVAGNANSVSAVASGWSVGIEAVGGADCGTGEVSGAGFTAVGNTGGYSYGILAEGGPIVFYGTKVQSSSNYADNCSVGMCAEGSFIYLLGDDLNVEAYSSSTSPTDPWANNCGMSADEGITICAGVVDAYACAGAAMNVVPDFGVNKYRYMVDAYANYDDASAIYHGNAKTAAREMGHVYVGNSRIKTSVSIEQNIQRIWGQWAADTAAEISEFTFAKSDWVIVARDDDFADAMSASGLAGALDCPIILTNYGELTQSAADEISRLGATNAYVIGGKYAIEEPVVNALKGMGLAVERVYGTACYDTSVACANKIAEITGNTATTDVIVAQSCNFQDALSISPLAYKYCLPIYLEKNSGAYDLPAEAVANINATNGTIWVPGGPYAVGTDTVEDVFGAGRVVRIYGTTGYDTSNLLAYKLCYEYFMLDNDALCIANGAFSLGGTDALAGASLAGKAGCPLVLVSAQPYFEGENYVTIRGGDSTGHTSYLEASVGSGNVPDVIYLLGGGFVLPDEFKEMVFDVAGYARG